MMIVFFTKLSLFFFACLFGSGKAMEFQKQEFYLASDEGLGQEIGQRLEAFFWTGSGDGPPAPEEVPFIEPTPPKTLVRTTTVLATVYLDGADPSMSVTDTSSVPCIGCGPDEGAGGPGPPGAHTPPDDPRYWLLTVVRGGTPDALQVRLARLYQKAFLRQQERHLGIIRALDGVNNRKKHEVQPFDNTLSNSTDTEDTNGTRELIRPSPSSAVSSSIIDLTENSKYFEAETFLTLPTTPLGKTFNASNDINPNEIKWHRHPKLLASDVMRERERQYRDNRTESQFIDKKKVQKRDIAVTDEDDWSNDSDAVPILDDFHSAKNEKSISITSLKSKNILLFLPASSVMTTHKKDLSAEDLTDWSDVPKAKFHSATPELKISPKSVNIGQKITMAIPYRGGTDFASKLYYNNIMPTKILRKREVDVYYSSTTYEKLGEDTQKETSEGDENVDDVIRDVEEEDMEEELNGHLEISDDDFNGTLVKRALITPEQQPPVKVHIHNISEISSTHDVEIVYSVLVGGRAVPAAVAARDMRFVHEREVARELGYPVTTKAEPYLKAALPLNGAVPAGGIWTHDVALVASGASLGGLLLLLVALLLCRSRRKRAASSAALMAYRNELMRQTLHIGHDKEDKPASAPRPRTSPSPSRTRPSSSLLPAYRADSTTSTSSGSGLSDIASALRLRQRRLDTQIQQARRGRHKKMRQKRVGAADSLLVSAGVSESDSGGGSIKGGASGPGSPSVRIPSIEGTPSVPPRLSQTPISYLSMPSVRSFPRGNTVEPLSKVLEPVSVRHLDIDSPVHTSLAARKHEYSTLSTVKTTEPTVPATEDRVDRDANQSSGDVVQRRQMASQLVRMGSMDGDPGVVGPLVWDLHCQRMKDLPRQKKSIDRQASTLSKQIAQCVSGPEVPGENTSRMRRRFGELVDDAFSLFGSRGGSPKAGSENQKGSLETPDERGEDDCFASLEANPTGETALAMARNDEVRFPGSQHSAIATIRGWDTHNRPTTSGTFMPSPVVGEGALGRPRTALPRQQNTALPRQLRTALPWQQQLPIEMRAPPTRAWDTPSPRVRATSAGVLPAPRVDVAHVLVDARLPPGDPALPLISAIKSEIQRVRDYTHTHPPI